MADPAILLIDTGDPASLAALCLQRDPSGVVIWSPIAAETVQSRCIQRHHEVFDTAMLLRGEFLPAPPLTDANMLLAASAAALAHGCRAVLWPVVRSDDLEASNRVLDLVSHIAAVVTVETGGEDITIDTPLLDLLPGQVLELILQQGVPLSLAWPFTADSQPDSDAARNWIAARSSSDMGSQPAASLS